MLLLAGCAEAPPIPDRVAPTAVATATVEPTRSGAEAPTAGGTPTSVASSDAPEPTLSGCLPAEFADRPPVGLEPQQRPDDRGSREYATGEPILGPDGVPVAYVVGSGDIPEYIADRFCLEVSYLDRINEPRRGSSAELFEGDTLNLDAATATTVGDVNGVIRQNPVSTSLPEQHEPVW
ncbi:hypothetical protein ASF48_08160 [Rathayibacter sp. Leaf299]|uniref:hypothetical protein n=1 Tax=Rathayibacter sp. Leaf248 TaxID=2876555 RepID=UPI0006FC49F8|nr:hypothetical protein [Rathayibacter sp. Leaf248]KQQ20589.1 hypothetical protein ASF48_08160 [Rathayibacter sp. Leaf299]